MACVQKWPLFQPVFLGNVGKENVCYNILGEKNECAGHKKPEVDKVEILTFFQRGYLMVLVQNWPLFQTIFFLLQYRPGKCL